MGKGGGIDNQGDRYKAQAGAFKDMGIFLELNGHYWLYQLRPCGSVKNVNKYISTSIQITDVCGHYMR